MTQLRILTPLQKMLLDGADYLERWGHWKGAYFGGTIDYEGSVFPPACLMGSLQAAVKVYDHSELVKEGEEYMNYYLKVNDCTAWNDLEERTPAEVIQGLRDAAAAYREADKYKWDANLREAQENDDIREAEYTT